MDNREYDGLPLNRCCFSPGVLVVGLKRGHDHIHARGNTVIRAGDRVILIGSPEEVARLRELLEEP